MSFSSVRHARIQIAVGVGVLALLGSACSSDSDSSGAALKVTATDKSCELDGKAFGSGQLNVEVMNEGDKVTEVYVYGKEDRVMGEVENIGPGTSRDFTVKLGAGSYEVACKPGQTGDGIRSAIEVTGKADEQSADRSVSFDAKDFAFEGLGDLAVSKGETIEFRMHNEGSEQHEFEVLDDAGTALGEIGPTEADATGVAVLTFDKAGTYRYICDIDDHRSRGMAGTFVVE